MSDAAVAEYSFGTGGGFDAEYHGAVDVGWRRPGWRVELHTDTLELAREPAWKHGRAWVELRGQAFAAGMWIYPWTDGARDPSRAARATVVGADAGAIRYLPHGWYVGVRGGFHYYWFGAYPDSEALPEDRPIGTADALLGWWTKDASFLVYGGLDAEPTGPEPHLAGELLARTPGVVVPRVELRGELANGQTDATFTRLGGLTPYNPPLAGAAWAEWWVEDYVETRLGPELRTDHWTLATVVDGAAWSDRPTTAVDRAIGFALLTEGRAGPWYADADLGVAPWIPRPEGDTRWSAWLYVGRRWGPLANPE